MYIGTTPTLPIEILGIDLTAAKVFLTIEDAAQRNQFTLTAPEDFTVTYDAEHDKTTGHVTLTQKQTLSIKAGQCRAQIRFIFADGSADATNTVPVTFDDILMKGVISYE